MLSINPFLDNPSDLLGMCRDRETKIVSMLLLTYEKIAVSLSRETKKRGVNEKKSAVSHHVINLLLVTNVTRVMV